MKTRNCSRGAFAGATAISCKILIGAILAVIQFLAIIPAIFVPVEASPSAETEDVSADELPAPPRGEKRVEVPSLRTEYSRTYALPSGLYESEIYTGSVNYRTGGAWEPIDNTLVPSDRPGYAYESAANSHTLLIPEDISSNPIRVQLDDGGWITYTPEGASGPPTIDGTTATFEDALGDVDFSYWASGDGVQEHLELPDASAPTTYAFELDASAGIEPHENASGEIRFSRESEPVDFRMTAPLMYESTGDEQTSTDVALDLAPAEDAWDLDLSISAPWLSSSARDFPVVVDPQLEFKGANGGGSDCYIWPNQGPDPVCTSDQLRIGYNGTNYRRTLLRFPVRDPGGSAWGIPRQSVVLNARVELTITGSSGTATEPLKDVGIHRVIPSWNDQATWNKRNGTSDWAVAGANGSADRVGDPGDITDIATNATTAEWFPTEIVQRWVDRRTSDSDPAAFKHDVNGFLLKYDGTRDKVMFFGSKEHAEASKQPRLIVTYAPWHGMASHHQIERQSITDRLDLGVNVADGNLVLSAKDLSIMGTSGLDLNIERYYNHKTYANHGPYDNVLGKGWSLSVGPDIKLEVFKEFVGYFGPGRQAVTFKQKLEGDPPTFQGKYEEPFPHIDADLKKDGSQWILDLHQNREQYVFEYVEGIPDPVLKVHRDKSGNTITFNYANGRLANIVDTQNRTFNFNYYNSGNLAKITDPAGREYRYRYNDDNQGDQLVAYEDPANNEDSGDNDDDHPYRFEYNINGDLSKITDPRDNATLISYTNERKVDLVTRVTDSSQQNQADKGPTTNFDYYWFSGDDDKKATTEVFNPNNHRTIYQFDYLGRVDQTTVGSQPSSSRKFDEATNKQSETTSAGGATTTFQYNSSGAMTSITSPSSGTMTMGYGDSNNPFFPTSITEGSGKACELNYADWKDTENKKGNLRWVKCGGTTTWYDYNSKGSLTRIDPTNDCQSRDPDNNLSTNPQKDCSDQQIDDTLLTYYDSGNLKNIIPPTYQEKTTFKYFGDRDWLVSEMIDGKHQFGNPPHGTTYTYDKLDRLTSATFWDGLKVEYFYDLNGNLTERRDPSGTTKFTYDALNRMTTRRFDPAGNAGEETTSFTYDKVGNLVTLTDSGGTTDYGYNTRELLTSVDPPGMEPPTTFEYNDNNLRTKTKYPMDIADHYFDMVVEYDGANGETDRIKRIYGITRPDDTILFDFRYTYSTNGNAKTALRETATDEIRHREWTYDYDGQDRLDLATLKNKSTNNILNEIDYFNSTRHNVWKVVEGPPGGSTTTTRYTFNDANELDTKIEPGTADYNYDLNGNFTGTESGDYASVYNTMDQSTSIDTPYVSGSPALTMAYSDFTQDERVKAGDADFRYNRLGLGAERRPSSNDVYYIRDTEGTIVAMREDVPNEDNDNYHYYMLDALGSVVGLVDESKNVRAKWAYDPYGATSCVADNGCVSNPWRFAGGYFDAQTRLYKFGTRYYDPNLMRWTQKDPKFGRLTDPITLNSYQYGGLDPVNVTDPTGRDEIPVECWVFSGAGGLSTWMSVRGIWVKGTNPWITIGWTVMGLIAFEGYIQSECAGLYPPPA